MDFLIPSYNPPPAAPNAASVAAPPGEASYTPPPASAKPGGDIIIHPTDNSGIRGAAPNQMSPEVSALIKSLTDSATSKPTVDSGAGIDEKLKQYFDMIHGSANDDDKKREQAGLLRIIQGGLAVAGGTSPFFGANLSKAGEAVQGYGQDLAAIDASKEKRIQQLVSLGLTGEQLKMEASKLGISQQELEQSKAKNALTAALVPSEIALRGAQTGLAGAQAGYYGRKSGTTGSMGLGSVPASAYLKLQQEYRGYEADPKSAPFFSKLPADAQMSLTKLSPTSSSYQKSMEVFRQAAKEDMGKELQTIRILGAKTNPFASLLDQD